MKKNLNLTDKMYNRFATDKAFLRRTLRNYEKMAKASDDEAAKWEGKGQKIFAAQCRAEAAEIRRIAASVPGQLKGTN